MRILWFANTPSLYKRNEKGYNGGGWISSLQAHLSNEKGIELGVGFLHKDTDFKTVQGNVTYYPISLYRTKIQKIKHHLFYRDYDDIEVESCLKIIDDFRPDLIHIFGSESSFGLLANKVKTPVVIHLQGLLMPCTNAWFPPGSNRIDYFLYNGMKGFQNLKTYSFFKHNSNRELKIFQRCQNYMGRTEWDKQIIKIYAPNAQYFYCGEILRKQFYEAPVWRGTNNNTFTIVTTISKVSYKGFDLVLKTAEMLKKYCNLNFEWRIFGIKEYNFWEKKLKIKAKDVGIRFMGVADVDTLISEMLGASLYVHPSYIDNSPNSICEAQLLGLPIISTNVGGIESLITDSQTGLLIPANDPHMLAAKILEISKDKKKAEELGSNARKVALTRHDESKIVKDVVDIYQSLVN